MLLSAQTLKINSQDLHDGLVDDWNNFWGSFGKGGNQNNSQTGNSTSKTDTNPSTVSPSGGSTINTPTANEAFKPVITSVSTTQTTKTPVVQPPSFTPTTTHIK